MSSFILFSICASYCTLSASGLAEAWEKVFDLFGRADVRGVELAAILTPERSK